MDNKDKQRFMDALNNAHMLIGKDSLLKPRVIALFDRYAPYDMQVMLQAISACESDAQVGFSGITPALLDKHLGVKSPADLKAFDIIALGLDRKCPLGVLISLKIGAKDLREKEPKDLTVQAKQFINNLPEELGRLNSGHLSTHEIAIMHKYNVDPARQGAMLGMPLPYGMQELTHRINHAVTTDIYKLHNEPEEALRLDVNPEGQARAKAEMMKVLFSDEKDAMKQAAIASDKAVFNEMMK